MDTRIIIKISQIYNSNSIIFILSDGSENCVQTEDSILKRNYCHKITNPAFYHLTWCDVMFGPKGLRMVAVYLGNWISVQTDCLRLYLLSLKGHNFAGITLSQWAGMLLFCVLTMTQVSLIIRLQYNTFLLSNNKGRTTCHIPNAQKTSNISPSGINFGMFTYPQTSNISHTLVSNKIVDHSDVIGASPVGAAPTTSSFST